MEPPRVNSRSRDSSNSLGGLTRHEGNVVLVEKDNLESLPTNAPLSDVVVGVLRTLGLGEASEVIFSTDSNPGRVSIVHGTTADVIWCDESGAESTTTRADCQPPDRRGDRCRHHPADCRRHGAGHGQLECRSHRY